jgi:hypothetical protein
VELIRLLRLEGELSRVRAARQKMSELFPLTEGKLRGERGALPAPCCFIVSGCFADCGLSYRFTCGILVAYPNNMRNIFLNVI